MTSMDDVFGKSKGKGTEKFRYGGQYQLLNHLPRPRLRGAVGGGHGRGAEVDVHGGLLHELTRFATTGRAMRRQ
jgi:hypothetical protein